MRERALATIVAVLFSGPALADDMTELNPITVTATRSEHAAAEAPASITVITAEEIRAKGATNLLEALRGVPGITLAGKQVGGRKNITIRGAEDRHTLVLIDGRRVSSTDDVIGHSDYQYGWVSLDQVERIEVVRGPMSALYGSEAMGGVVNIITKKAGKEWRGGATVRGDATQGAGGDGYQVSASAGGPLGNGFRLSVSGEQLRETQVPLPEDHGLTELEGRERTSGTVELVYEPVEGQEFSFNVLKSKEQRWRGNQESSGAFRYYQDKYDLDRTQTSLGYRGEWGKVRPEIRFTRSDFEVTSSRSMGVAPTRPQALRDDIADGNVAFPAGGSQLFTLGGEYRKETLENAGLIGGSDSAVHKAVYLQDEINLLETLSLTLGGRSDTHEIFGTEFSPRAYLVWKATPSLTVKTGYGEAFRAPTLKQISPSYVGAEGPHTFYGNANIKPETSRSYEFGLDWRDADSVYTATVFRNDIDDLISLRLLSVGPGIRRHYIYDNISRARIDGAEFSAWQGLGGGFAASASVLYLDAANRDTGAKLTGRPKFSINPTVEWTGGPWFASVSAEYAGTQYLAGTSGDEKAPDYTLLHLSGSYQLRENARLRAGLRNITDVRLQDESPLFGYAEQGRSAYLALDLTF
jgi:outer membrane receptor for ferrienterochelin and colicins